MKRQLELVFPSRGGARRGAGRPRRPGSNPAHTPRPRVSRHVPVLVTMRARVRYFRRTDVCRRVFECLSRAQQAGRSRISVDRFRVTRFSVQSDHLHLIVESQDERALARGQQGLAIRIARRVNAMLRRAGRVWDQRYHAFPLRSPRQVRSALVYVLHNRKKHGPLATPLDEMSSCAWFDGWSDLDQATERIARNTGPPPVSPPRSWLLRIGWRGLGLLSIHEAPRARRRVA